MVRKQIGLVTVDSGQLLFTDPAYLTQFDNDSHDSVLSDLNAAHERPAAENYPFSYGGACAATSNVDQGGQLQVDDHHGGVAVRTGLGDGVYPVYAELLEPDDVLAGDPEWVEFVEGRVARVEIDFIPPEAEDNA